MICWIIVHTLYYRCTADCGWITGHSYVTYGPMLNGATVVVYEGASQNFLCSFNTWMSDLKEKDCV